MHSQVYLGRDNEIRLRFAFDGDFAADGLANFDRIEATIGGELYSTTSTPANLFVDGDDLVFSIGDATSLPVGYHHVLVVGYSGVYDDGFILMSTQHDGICRVQIIDAG